MKSVAVIFGSRSAEHDVSIVTAFNAIIEPLELAGSYSVIPVYIAKDGRWYSDKQLAKLSFFTNSDFDKKLAKLKPIGLEFNHGLWLANSGFAGGRQKVDVVFPATHGTYGEDGSLMGVLRMADVPFVGCDLEASAIAMDKGLSKLVTEKAGLLSPDYVLFSKQEFSDDEAGVFKQLGKLKFPLFVKPTHLGSSIAISRVKDRVQLKNAIEVALNYDDKVIVEEAVPNLIEVTVPVIGNQQLTVALVEEALNKHADFFDFTSKYIGQGKGKKGGVGTKGSYSRLPANISKTLYKQCEEVAKTAYRAIGASGIARVDLLINSKTNQVYFNEINPLPGSLYVHNWKAAGISAVELAERLIVLAEERHQQSKQLNTVFETNFLQQF